MRRPEPRVPFDVTGLKAREVAGERIERLRHRLAALERGDEAARPRVESLAFAMLASHV